MDQRLAANRTNWNDRVPVHRRSRFYDVDGWLLDQAGPPPREIEALGDVHDRTLVHLQCHFGLDTLRWARAGATVTGLDFSPAAIDEAIALSKRAGLSERATFVCANVYDALEVLAGRNFEIVYVSLGSLCWLPDVAAWGKVVAGLLAPQGRVYLHDVHPFAFSLDDDGERIIYSYFEEPDAPLVDEGGVTYTDGAALEKTMNYEWNHSIGEMVTALGDHGVVLDALVEHDWTLFRQFPWLVETPTGHFAVPEGRPRIPLSFTLLAHAAS